MAKITLGNRPKHFKRVVKFQMLDGTTGNIEVTYIYRTRKEFGDLVDDLVKAAGQQAQPADDGTFSMRDLMEKTAGANANYIMQVIDGWNLDEDFSEASVQQLADELPGAALAIMETYRAACTEGRLGN
jgi:hypothetical protein